MTFFIQKPAEDGIILEIRKFDTSTNDVKNKEQYSA
jgi:hypothetical protein